MGDTQRNGHWERRHKFSDFGCTVCHDGQGRGLENYYSHGEDAFWPDPLLGYVTQANWRKEFKPHLKGKEYHGSQLRPVPHRREFRRHAARELAAASCSSP